MAAVEERVSNLEQGLAELRELVTIGFQSLRDSHLQTQQELRDFKNEMAEFKNEMAEFKNEMAEFKNEMAEFKNEMAEFKSEMAEFKSEMAEFKSEMAEFKNEMSDFKSEMSRFKDENNRRWGDLANKMGTLVEDLVHPSLPRIVKEKTGLAPQFTALNLRKRLPDGREREFDAVALGGPTLFLNSTKSKLKPQHMEAFVEEIESFRLFFPEYADRKIVGVLATLSVTDDLIALAEKAGFYVMAIGGTIMELKNRPQFQPREW